MQHLNVERDGAIAVVTITPSDEHMTNRTVVELAELLPDLAADSTIHAVILTGGHPGYFIRHYSVHELEKMSLYLRGGGELPATRLIDQLFDGLAQMDQPVIAALNGTAMGGGFELALACDFRIAQAGDFAFGQPEVNIGILPGAGGTQRLARIIGMARALDLALTGRTVGPEEALRLGMVHEVVPDALARARELAATLAARPPRAVAAIKRLLRIEAEKPLSEALAIEAALFNELVVRDDALELMQQMNRENADIRDMSR